MAERAVVSFRADEQLLTQLQRRVGGHLAPSPHQAAERDLGRYYDMLQRSLPTFSEGEASLIVDVFNGSIIQSYSASHLWLEISQALAEGYAEKWGVDGPALVEKLRRMTPFECLAVEDATELYWNVVFDNKTISIKEALIAVGLVKNDEISR